MIDQLRANQLASMYQQAIESPQGLETPTRPKQPMQPRKINFAKLFDSEFQKLMVYQVLMIL